MIIHKDNISPPGELLIRVDAQDNIIGYETKEKCHRGKGLLHRAFSIFIFNDQGQLLLQRRSEKKLLWPLFWSNSVCSHPRKGESYEMAALRRIREELGFETALCSLFSFQYKAGYQNIGTESEMCSVFIGKSNGILRPDPNEIADLKYVNLESLDEDILCQAHRYTPWFRMEWNRIRKQHCAEIDYL
jgi:isopentenyl-diphosphate delta-isomerase